MGDLKPMNRTLAYSLLLIGLPMHLWCIQPVQSEIRQTSRSKCTLVKNGQAHHFSFATGVTFIQRSYIFELCNMVSARQAELEVERLEIEGESLRGAPQASHKLMIRRQLNELAGRSEVRLADLLEKAITSPTFDEELFWDRWQLERNDLEKAMTPLFNELLPREQQ